MTDMLINCGFTNNKEGIKEAIGRLIDGEVFYHKGYKISFDGDSFLCTSPKRAISRYVQFSNSHKWQRRTSLPEFVNKRAIQGKVTLMLVELEGEKTHPVVCIEHDAGFFITHEGRMIDSCRLLTEEEQEKYGVIYE